jgi:hypothetical protein
MTAALPIPAARSGHLTTPDQLTTELSSELAAALDMLVSLATDAHITPADGRCSNQRVFRIPIDDKLTVPLRRAVVRESTGQRPRLSEDGRGIVLGLLGQRNTLLLHPFQEMRAGQHTSVNR